MGVYRRGESGRGRGGNSFLSHGHERVGTANLSKESPTTTHTPVCSFITLFPTRPSSHPPSPPPLHLLSILVPVLLLLPCPLMHLSSPTIPTIAHTRSSTVFICAARSVARSAGTKRKCIATTTLSPKSARKTQCTLTAQRESLELGTDHKRIF
ncbi:MAG: hypothetical protein J3Q66DRAFT_91712 [Benniella sp.]|nr:MAG: hypothetical protein J3Q66DRAFT_91712 [Benniella sp.]